MTFCFRPTQIHNDIAAGSDLANVREFLEIHGQALANAANLLGGTAASGVVFILLESLNAATTLSNTQRKQLIRLHQLLTLQNTEDFDRVESVLFAGLDLASPEVEEICLLADGLEKLLHRIAVPPSIPFLSSRTSTKSNSQHPRSKPKRLHPLGGTA